MSLAVAFDPKIRASVGLGPAVPGLSACGHGLAEPGEEPLPATAFLGAGDTHADGEVWCRPRRSFDSVWRGTLIYVPYLGLELRRLRVVTLPGRFRFKNTT